MRSNHITECCKVASLVLATTSVVESSSVATFGTSTMNYSPSDDIVISLNLTLINNYATSALFTPSILPISTFVISSSFKQGAALSFPFVAGSAATYSLDARITGPSAAEYAEVKFLSNHTVAVLLSMNHGNGFSANSRYLSLSLSLLR